MIQTLTTPIGGPSLTFLNNNRSSPSNSTAKVYLRRHKPCNAVLNADPVVDSVSKRCYSLYEVLKVKRDATANEIKAAYRNLAKVYHPDSSDFNKHDDGKFIEIHDAYATLCDPVDRAMYDLKLNMGSGQGLGLGFNTTVGKHRYMFRRWETDQCW